MKNLLNEMSLRKKIICNKKPKIIDYLEQYLIIKKKEKKYTKKINRSIEKTKKIIEKEGRGKKRSIKIKNNQ